MSYGFQFTVATKDEAKARVVTDMDNVVAQQPSHAKDKPAALAAANAFIDMLVDDPAVDVRVEVYGSLGWRHNPSDPYGTGQDTQFTSANVSVTAYHTTKA